MHEGEYIPQYRDLFATGANFRGLSVLRHVRTIQTFVRQTGAVTLLDYGSGAGDAYEEPYLAHVRWGTPRPTLYDPAIPALATRPDDMFDGIICSDVMEHIPQHELEDAIVYMLTHARLFIWTSICCRPAKKLFADGITNLHVTIRPFEWWQTLFEGYARRCGYRGALSLTESM